MARTLAAGALALVVVLVAMAAVMPAQAQTPSANITAFRNANPGLQYVVLADITAGGTNDLYTRGRFGSSGTATTDSDLDLDTEDPVILIRTQTREGQDGGAIQLNHGGDLTFTDFVGTGGVGSDLTVYLMLSSDTSTTYSFLLAGNVNRVGGRYVNLLVPLDETPDVQAAWGGITTGTRFVFALARSAPANNPPTFDSATAARTVVENATGGTTVGAPVTATDSDTGDMLEYSIAGDANFTIASASGQIQVAAAASLNYETDTSHIVTVSASDGDDSATIAVTITVTNVDEVGSVGLSPAQPSEDAALTATLTDPDGSLSSVTWQWASSDSANGTFTDIAGETSARYTPESGDVGMYLRATAGYTDGHGSGKIAQAVAGNAVAERNDPPSFVGTTTTRSVAENRNSGTNVGAPVTASDPGDTLTYSISGANPGGFDIGGSSGQIQTGQRLDHEDRDSYGIIVQAEDTAGQTDTIRVTIGVTNVDEAGTVTLSALRPTEDDALTATLADPDGSVSSISWQWARSISATGAFNDIAGATSASYTPISGDVGMYLRATASYTDGQGSGKTAQAVAGSTVAGRDYPPEFATQITARSVPENSPAGTPVGTPVTASDPGDTLTYSLGGASEFEIVATTGQIRVAAGADLNFESVSSYTVEVTARDSANQSASITVTISIMGRDESTPIPQAGAQTTGQFAYLGTVHLFVGSDPGNNRDGYMRNGYGGITAGDLPGALFRDGRARPVGEVSIARGNGQLRIAYAQEELGLIKSAEALKWMRVQVRAVDNSIIAETNLWQGTACADRSLCRTLAADLSTHVDQAVAVDFFDAVREALNASPGGVQDIVIVAADTGSDSTGFDSGNGDHVGGHLPGRWFKDGDDKGIGWFRVHHGSSGRVVEIAYDSSLNLQDALWRYDPDLYRDYRLTVWDRSGQEVVRVDLGRALGTLGESSRRCGDSSAQRRICFPYDDEEFDGADYRGQVVLVQLEDTRFARMVADVPGGEIGAQLWVALFAGALVGWRARRTRSPVREYTIIAAMMLGAMIPPFIGVGNLFWPMGILIVVGLAAGAAHFLGRSR